MTNNRRNKGREQRKSRDMQLRAETWLVVCEGTKTEPQYFKSLIDYVNTLSDKKIRCVVKGTGTNTEYLVNNVEKEKSSSKIPYGKIFVVFDKDSFDDKFDKTIEIALNNGYISLWSNECFEVWYLLHFNYFNVNTGREKYYEKLSRIFGYKYEKNRDCFSSLNTEVNLRKALRNAKRLCEQSSQCTSHVDRSPCTMVYLFIEYIEEELGIKL